MDGRDTICERCTPPGSSTGAWLNEHHDELEAERRRKHAEWISDWGALMRQRRKQIAANRRAVERRRHAAWVFFLVVLPTMI